MRGVSRLRPRGENGARAGAGVALVPADVADHVADGAQRGQRLAPALLTLLLVLDGVPGEEDEDEAHELEAGRQAKVDEAEGGDVVLPARAVNPAVLLPQHARSVDHCTKIDGSGDVGCRREGETKGEKEGERERERERGREGRRE